MLCMMCNTSFYCYNKKICGEVFMLEIFNKLFTEYIKLAPEYWAIVFLSVILLTFFITLVVSLVTGRFNEIRFMMAKAVSAPNTVVALMKKMPVSIKKQYKLARTTDKEPSAYVTEHAMVTVPFRSALINKFWLVTLVATISCTVLAYFIIPLAASTVKPIEGASAEEIVRLEKTLALAGYAIPAIVMLFGSVLTLIAGIIGKAAYSGAIKLYAKFVPVLDGDSKSRGQTQEQLQMQMPNTIDNLYGLGGEPVQFDAQQQPQQYEETQPIFTEQQPVYDPKQDYFEPVQETPITTEPPRQSDEEIRRKEREERDAARKAAAQAYAAEQSAARRAAAEQAVKARTESRQAAASTGSTTVDDVIARIEQIDREGAPRETMREVAALLQKERAKPENKNPEQQKKLNDALSKLLKAMSAASRK